MAGHGTCLTGSKAPPTSKSGRYLGRQAIALDMPVQMTVQWSVSPQEAGAILSALHSLMVAVRGEPGCICCHLTTEMGDRTGLRYVEKWKEEEDLKRQLRSPRFARLAELIERAVETPKVEFTLAAGVRGLDYAGEVRGHGGEAA